MRRGLRILAIAAALAAPSFASAREETLHVFAASSLTEAFRDIAAVYRERNPGRDVECHFAGSQTLRTQIEEGAPADVIATADRITMDALHAAGLVDGHVVFARNRLVVVTPQENPKVTSLADLARPGVRIVIADRNVPVGHYAVRALASMARTGRYGDDFEERVTANLVSRETNVRAVLAKVSLDEVDAGFVYATDATSASAKIRALEIPDGVNVAAEYPIAALASGRAKDAAARFVSLVLAVEGQALLAKRGFQPAP